MLHSTFRVLSIEIIKKFFQKNCNYKIFLTKKHFKILVPDVLVVQIRSSTNLIVTSNHLGLIIFFYLIFCNFGLISNIFPKNGDILS